MYGDSPTASVLLVLIIVGGCIIIVIYNRSKIPSNCPNGEGLIYNYNDIGALFGLGGYKCGICQPEEAAYVDSDGYCQKCEHAKYFDGENCVSCPKGHKLDPKDYTCKCDNRAGYFYINGKCTRCPSDQIYINNKCDTCIGGDVVFNKCRCPVDKVFFDGKCVSCANGRIVDDECICPSGTNMTDMGCI